MTTKLQTINELQSELEKLTKTIAELNKDTHIIRDNFRQSGLIEPGVTATIEVLAGRSGAMKPTEVQMYGVSESGSQNVQFELLDITIMGNPQLINYQGTTVRSDRGLVKFYNTPRPVDWSVFGSSAGQGLCIVVRNMSKKLRGSVYVNVRGYNTDCDLIGRSTSKPYGYASIA